MAAIGIALTALALGSLYTFQSSIIYPSSINGARNHVSTPDEYGMEYEPVSLTTPDGETLECFSLKHDPNSEEYTNTTILILSPNAGNIGYSLSMIDLLYTKLNYNVFIYSYRGYGNSTGKPSEQGLKIDADCVMEYLTTDKQYSTSAIVLYGRSLGGAVAIYIAAHYGESISGVIIENTFLSIPKAVPHVFPLLKYLAPLVHQVWDSESLVDKISPEIPVMLMSARKDEIVPPSHMDEIFRKLKSQVKIKINFKNSNHNDTVVQEGYWERVEEFIDTEVD
ncbi:putative membrane protein [Spathaspora sp. JA1]|nr:putative membrane protein [Spathaspora sp. JA1]